MAADPARCYVSIIKLGYLDVLLGLNGDLPLQRLKTRDIQRPARGASDILDAGGHRN